MEQILRRWIAALMLPSVCLLTGCYLGPQKVTYPAPLPISGEHVLYPGEYRTVAAEIAAGVTGFGTLCFPQEHGTTRSSVAFRSDGAQLCFYTPQAGDVLTCMSVNGYVRRQPLIFHVYVSAFGLEIHNAQATLDVDGKSLISAAAVHDSSYGGGLDEATPGAKPINPGAATLIYSIPRTQLVFRFSEPCNPIANYRLSIIGVTLNGHEIEVPSVEFQPFSEWVQRYLD